MIDGLGTMSEEAVDRLMAAKEASPGYERYRARGEAFRAVSEIVSGLKKVERRAGQMPWSSSPSRSTSIRCHPVIASLHRG